MTPRARRGPVGKPEGTGRRRFLTKIVFGVAGALAALPIFRSMSDAPALGSEEQAPMPSHQGARRKMDHEDYMRRAIAVATKVPRLPFGAVIVHQRTGEILAEGFNRASESPTFHGEIDAINRCAAAHRQIDWTELELYTTAEPCPMCQGVIEWAGIATVYYGTSIPYLKDRGWWQIDIRADEVARRTPLRQCKIVGGILESNCDALFDAAPKGDFKQ